MIKIIEHIEGLISSKFALFKTTLSIIKLEARLAGMTVYPLLLNLCFLFVVLITLWLSVIILIGYYSFLFFGTILLGIVSVLLLNLCLFFGLLKFLTYNLNNMSFEKTRACLSFKEGDEHDKLKKKITQ